MNNSILLFLFTIIVLLVSVNGRRLLPELEGPPRNITSWDRIIAHGYPAERHIVETSDGYILSIVRIPHSSKESDIKSPPTRRPAVLLAHGLSSSSDIFLLPGPDNGLPFLLADAGYDVWLANARGNTYSKRHRKLSPSTRKFWEFGWHEIGEIDTAAIIDYILDLTEEKKIHFIGHSQGSAVYLVLMSMRPEYNDKIKTAHLLAPVAYQGNSKHFLFQKTAPFIGKPGKWSDFVMNREFYPGNAYLQRFLDTVCGGDTRLPKICRKLLFLVEGNELSNLNVTLQPLLFETHPAGASTNQLLHSTQLYTTDKFQQFNYGSKKNMKLYGQKTPPDYKLNKITSSVYIYYSDYDYLSTTADVERLASELPNLQLKHRVTHPKWGHLDFVVALDVKREINDLVVQICKEHDKLYNNAK